MSMEFNVFLRNSNFPDRAKWQKAIDEFGLPMKLDRSLDPKTNTGYVPVKLKDRESGFELYNDGSEELISDHPELAAAIGDRDTVLSFRWGGDLNEGGCSLAAAAALVKAFDAVGFDPQDGAFHTDPAELIRQAKECFGDA